MMYMKKKKKKKINPHVLLVFKTLGVMSVLLICIFAYLLYHLNILPTQYYLLIVGCFLFFDLLFVLAIFKFKKGLKIISFVFVCIFSLISSIGCYYIYHTNDFLNRSFRNRKLSYITTFYVVSAKNNPISSINDIAHDVLYYEGSSLMDQVKEKVNHNQIKEVLFQTEADVITMFEKVMALAHEVMIVEQTNYEMVFQLEKKFKLDDFKIIDTIEIKTEVDQAVENQGKKFNVYIGGNDFTNSLMDFNMILTINMDRHQVLMTSIPRDYYIPVVGHNGKSDTLSYMGAHGIETNRKSLEEFLGIQLAYFVKINTKSLVKIVDEVGGINYCSDVSFTTTHATILDSYDDSMGNKLKVHKGCQHLNGVETLTVARERLAFKDGDRQRQKNCQQIMMAILEQLKSTNTITNYNNILNSLADLYQTNLPREVITELIKSTINGANWEILNQSMDGTNAQGYVHLTTLVDYVMKPKPESVEEVKRKIEQVLK